MRVETRTERGMSEAELRELMREAIARHGSAEAAQEQLTGLHSLEDALEIARQVGIPEEHVRAAYQERQSLHQREQRRAVLRGGRQIAFLASLGALAGGIFAGMVVGPLGWFAAAGMAALAVILFLRLRAPIGDEELRGVDAMPVAGTCRVCGGAATSERSTFCEEHRYKGPASA